VDLDLRQTLQEPQLQSTNCKKERLQ